MLETIKTKITRRKWWAMVIGAVAPVLAAYLSDEVQRWEALQASTAVLVSYLFAQGAVDYGQARS